MGGQKAFTLIELMVVVVVIGMIAYPSVMRVLRGMEDD
ncbi:prepilin-type N-terminal cleavage/methylation domain-containing protein [Moraxella bovis]